MRGRVDRTRNKQSDYAADAPLDMRRLRKLALWGTAAAATLTVAVLVGMSDTGMRRMSFAVASWGKPDRPETRLAGTPAQPAAPAPVIVQRDPEALAEARRLAETVKAMAADRDRLLTRLSALERNFEDVTGSIKREISATRPLPPINLPSMTEAPAAPAPSAPAPEKLQNLPKIASSPAADPTPAPAPSPSPPSALPGEIPSAAPAPPNSANALVAMAPLDPSLIGGPHAGIPSFGLPGMPALPQAPDITASAPSTASANGATAPRIDFGIDIGGASNIEMIRAQWSMVRSQHPKLLEGLTPVVSIRDLRQRRTVELRLVAGPLANANAAAQLCAALNAAGLPSCQPAVFDGQRLALR
ncbi:MAG: hypothetical protein JWN71_1007 [Xanthobacteraceae bacterium]|nr:hypothetical protein [Xanthobacteraceae bacterium]